MTKQCLILLAFIVILGSAVGQKTCNWKELDLCLSSYFFQQKGLPTNDREMNARCDQSGVLYKCYLAFAKRCFSDIQRSLFDWLFTGNTGGQNYCGTREGSAARDQFYRMAPCLNSIGPERTKCVKEITPAVMHLEEVKYYDIIPGICCVYRSGASCFEAAVSRKCGPDHVHFFKYEFLGDNLNGLLEAICQKIKEGDSRCEKLMPPIGWVSKSTDRKALTRMLSMYV